MAGPVLGRKDLFSVRCGYVSDRRKAAALPLPMPARRTLIRCIHQHGRVIEGYYSWGEPVWGLPDIGGRFLYLHGYDSLKVWDEGKLRSAESLDDFLEKTAPYYFIDCLEIAADLQDDPERASAFREECNRIFAGHDVPLCFEGPHVVFQHSPYCAEVNRRACELLLQSQLPGPLEEFQKAIEFLREGRDDEAITNANCALESILKALLGKEGSAGGPMKSLLAEIKRAGVLPLPSAQLLAAVLGMIEAVSVVRHQKGSHGQGLEVQPTDHPLAELIVNVAGCAIVYLARVYETMRAAEAQWDELPF